MQRRPCGYLVIRATLVYLVLESTGIAVDQWFGDAADPASPVASVAVAPVLGALPLLALIPVYCLFRSLQDRAPGHGSRRSQPGG